MATKKKSAKPAAPAVEEKKSEGGKILSLDDAKKQDAKQQVPRKPMMVQGPDGKPRELTEKEADELQKQLDKRLEEFKKRMTNALDFAKHIYSESLSMDLVPVNDAVFPLMVTMNELIIMVTPRKPLEGVTLADLFTTSNYSLTRELIKKNKEKDLTVGSVEALLTSCLKIGQEIFEAQQYAPEKLKDEFVYALNESNTLRIRTMHELFILKSK